MFTATVLFFMDDISECMNNYDTVNQITKISEDTQEMPQS